MTATLRVLKKDLLIEWRARSRTLALASFALTVLLLFSFAVGPDTKTLRLHAGGYLWLAILLSSTLLLARSFRTELESGALETVILAPIVPAALFYGKAIANTLQLLIVSCVAWPAVAALCDAGLRESPLLLVLTLVLGTAGRSMLVAFCLTVPVNMRACVSPCV